MEKKKFDALLQKTMRALLRIAPNDDKYTYNCKFSDRCDKKFYKIQEKLEKKIGNESYFFMGELCLILARNYPEFQRSYTFKGWYFLECAYLFNDGDSRALDSLRKNFDLMELPDADGKPFYFYFKWSPTRSDTSEPFEFEGKLYREIYPLGTLNHNSDHYVTCTKSSEGEMTYQLVTDYAERDALHKRKWST